MALSARQAVGSAAATIQKAKLKRQQGGMSQASDKPLGKPVVRRVPNSIDQAPSAPGSGAPIQRKPVAMPNGPTFAPMGVVDPRTGQGQVKSFPVPQGGAQGDMSAGAQGGGAAPPSGGPQSPQSQDLMRLLPPKMQAAMAQNGRDPREAIATRMQNDPIFKQKMVAMQQQGGFPGGLSGGPPSGPSMSLPMQPPPDGPRVDPGGDSVQVPGGPDSAVSGVPGQSLGGPMPPPPPGADIGAPMPPGQPAGTQGGFGGMNQVALRRMLPPAMQALQGAQGAYGQATPWPMFGPGVQQGGFQGNPKGLNMQSLQAQMQGGGPAPGGQPQLGGVNPYRGM